MSFLVDDRHDTSFGRVSNVGDAFRYRSRSALVRMGQQHLSTAESTARNSVSYICASPICPTAVRPAILHGLRAYGPARRFMPSAIAPLDTMMTSRPRTSADNWTAPFPNGLFVQAAAFVGDQAGADLDHDAVRVTHHSLKLQEATFGLLAPENS